ncbi:MAG: hypothetical protein Q607_CBUC00214G0110 [Clostridium butyricum DORA_1]|uniref:TetR/AcrR family transcriptional regulator n=1 Tax=Clostridium butyricum TaxID=1492 RepID=UPI0003D611A1|nr:MAG: hypothetical protein Q607_CBUC00214G0110 [Clostridium butyricum DORA_1]
MRISKNPEERKQEIIDTAMNLFAQKGYEFTSMRDIAKEMNVVSGLCYRYFNSKEDLYKIAVNMYAKECSAPIIEFMNKNWDDIDTFMDMLSQYFISVDGKERYHNFFHKNRNKLFHKQLESLIISIIEPHLISLLYTWKKRNLIKTNDIEYAAKFILYGQMPIINDYSILPEKKMEIVKHFILKILN